MAFLWVNGAAVATPSEMKVEIFEVGSGEARSAAGDLVVDRVAVKRRLTLGWAAMGADELGALLEAVKEPFFQVTCPDPELGQRTMTCRCESRTAGVLRLYGGEPVWKDVQMVWTQK